MKKFAALLLALAMLLSVVPMAVAETAAEPTVIVWGTHWAPELDPHMIDEGTGKYTISNEADRLIRIEAEKAVLEKHNVVIEYIQYPNGTEKDLLLSVVAGNPICDLAIMWNGIESTVLSQNVLQPLDDYAYIFEGADWMLPAAVYGHQYFLNKNVTFNQYAPLMVNLTMLDQVPALKEADGTTLYPMELLERGEWTWSNFKAYLEKVNSYWGNVDAPEGSYNEKVVPYVTDIRQSAKCFAYTNGGAVYGANGLQVAAQETIDAVAYLKEMMDLGLICGMGLGDWDPWWHPNWCRAGDDFGRGGAVFADVMNWNVKWRADQCAERNEAVAMMPWPRADRLDADSPEYRQAVGAGDFWGALKGNSTERTTLALESFRTYWETYYALSAGVESMDDYKAAVAKTEANARGLDIFNEEYGASVLNAFIYNSEKCMPNDFSGMVGIGGIWEEILCCGFWGMNGVPAYDIAINANLDKFSAAMADMEAILGTEGFNDTVAPQVTVTGSVLLNLGADVNAYDWTQHFAAEDVGFDGIMDPAMGAYDLAAVDTATAGVYKVKASFTDKAGNTGSAEVEVVVYDAANTTEPTLTVVDELPSVAMDADASAIDWTAYVAEAKDASGLDLKAKVVADVSVLDTSMPDVYPVTLTVTDYAGNTASVEIEVEVVVE